MKAPGTKALFTISHFVLKSRCFTFTDKCYRCNEVQSESIIWKTVGVAGGAEEKDLHTDDYYNKYYMAQVC